MRSAIRAKTKLPALAAAALMLLILLSPTAAAETGDTTYQGDFEYIGEVDPETGYPPGWNGTTTDGRTAVSAAMSYDSVKGMYVYALDDGTECFCSAADGMVLTEPALLQYTGSMVLTVYKNGEPLDLASSGEINQVGSYVITQGSDTGVRVCGFTLVPRETNLIHSYSLPDGFFIREVTLDGEAAEFSRYYVDLEREGRYRIDYRCPAAEKDYTLDVVIDRTPPELLLKGSVGRDGKVHSAVEVSGLEENDTLSVLHDGASEFHQLEDGICTLTDTGTYIVTATDPAGNSVSYEFTIMLYLNTNSILFILLLIAIVASIFIYAWWKRKSLKVR